VSADAGRPAFVDLHTHSTASDGTFAPEGVIEAAQRCGLAALALTDHDTIDGVPAARVAGERLGVRVIAGVELSAFQEDNEIHLLALHVTHIGALETRLSELRTGRYTRAQKIVEKLHILGIPLTLDEVLMQSNGGAVGRPHVARALIARGVVQDFREAFTRYLGTAGSAFVARERLSIEDAISVAHEAGALAIWAHPGDGGRRERLEPLVAAGLEQLPAFYFTGLAVVRWLEWGVIHCMIPGAGGMSAGFLTGGTAPGRVWRVVGVLVSYLADAPFLITEGFPHGRIFC